MTSLLVHLALLLVLGALTLPSAARQTLLLLASHQPEEEPVLQPKEFYFSDEFARVPIGAQGLGGTEAVTARAPSLADLDDVRLPEFQAEVSPLTVEIPRSAMEASELSVNIPVRGVSGEGALGAVGAIDRLTHEILLSLEQRRTLVVWMFDQSGSLRRQRAAISERFHRVYEELGVIESSGNPAFAKHEDKPLLTAVMQFGAKCSYLTDEPTDRLDEIRDAVRRIEDDQSGIENVFTAVTQAATRFRAYRTRNPRRNVMLILVTDEAGDDEETLDATVRLCRKLQMPVYVVGIPAPFGRREVEMKYADDDPRYDQSIQWIPVHQGPETPVPERVRVLLPRRGDREEPIDSGFGPYALTRLCYETGGIYFTVHPNRTTERTVHRGETAQLSAHLAHFFDPLVMRQYRPDYASREQYQRLVESNQAREALVRAAGLSWAAPLENPRLVFPRRDEADLANLLTVAQRAAAILEPRIEAIYETLHSGEAARAKLTGPRWQAGYDLAMGTTLATMVRIKGYNTMLAQAKQGMRFQNSGSDTWVLGASDEVTSGSALQKQAVKAREYLQRVVQEHPGTPWELLAKAELAEPLGWKWEERFTGVNTPRPSTPMGGGGRPRNDVPNNLVKPKELRRPNL